MRSWSTKATRIRWLIVGGDLRLRLRFSVRHQATRRSHLICFSTYQKSCYTDVTEDWIFHLRSPRLFGSKGDMVVARARKEDLQLLESKWRKPEAPTHINHVVPIVRRVHPDVIKSSLHSCVDARSSDSLICVAQHTLASQWPPNRSSTKTSVQCASKASASHTANTSKSWRQPLSGTRSERASFFGPQRFDLSWSLIWETYCFWSSYVHFLSERRTQRTKLSEGGKASSLDLQGASRSSRCSKKWTPWFLRRTHLQTRLQHAFGNSVACNGLGSWFSCCVCRSLPLMGRRGVLGFAPCHESFLLNSPWSVTEQLPSRAESLSALFCRWRLGALKVVASDPPVDSIYIYLYI